FRSVLAFQNFMLVMAVIFGVQFADRGLGPILPLYVVHRGVPADQVPVVSGVLFSIAAGFGALGNTLCGRVLRRLSPRVSIAAGSALALAGLLLFAGTGHLVSLALAMTAFGFGTGLALTAAYTVGGRVIPEGAHGAGFGVLQSAYLTALAISPVVTGLLSALDLRVALLANAAVLGVLVTAVWRTMRESAEGVPAATVEAAPTTMVDGV
ncbi:MAG: MFS transporter, partial [Acidobacteria bacterium]|nr:MFS transporter [Acidobacteriota bacterium]